MSKTEYEIKYEDVQEINDFSHLHYEFYSGNNKFLGETVSTNNVIVKSVKENNREKTKKHLLDIENTFKEKVGTFVTEDEIKKYNFNSNFLDVYGIYKFSQEDDDFFRYLKSTSYMYMNNYQKFLKLKRYDKYIVDFLSGKKEIQPTNTQEIFMLLAQKQEELTTDEFFSLKTLINNIEDKELSTFLNQEVEKKMLNQDGGVLMKKVLENLTKNFFDLYIELFQSLGGELEALDNMVSNSLYRKKSARMPKTSNKDGSQIFYGKFKDGTKYYNITTPETKIELPYGAYKENFIDTPKLGKIYYLRGNSALLFDRDDFDITLDEGRALKKYFKFLNSELCSVMSQMASVGMLERTKKKFKISSNQVNKEIKTLKDMASITSTMFQENLTDAVIIFDKLDELDFIAKDLSKTMTADNFAKSKGFLEGLEATLGDNYTAMMDILARGDESEIKEAYAKFMVDKKVDGAIIKNVDIKSPYKISPDKKSVTNEKGEVLEVISNGDELTLPDGTVIKPDGKLSLKSPNISRSTISSSFDILTNSKTLSKMALLEKSSNDILKEMSETKFKSTVSANLISGNFYNSSLLAIVNGDFACMLKGLMSIIGNLGLLPKKTLDFLKGLVTTIKNIIKIINTLLSNMVCLLTLGVGLVSLFLVSKSFLKSFTNLKEALSVNKLINEILPTTIDTIVDYIKEALKSPEETAKALMDEILKVEDVEKPVEAISEILKDFVTETTDGEAQTSTTTNEITGSLKALCVEAKLFDYLVDNTEEKMISGMNSALNKKLSKMNLTPAEKAKAFVVLSNHLKECDEDIKKREENKNNIAKAVIKELGKMISSYCVKSSNPAFIILKKLLEPDFGLKPNLC